VDYNEAVLYLENSHRFGSKQGHENFLRLMSLLGNPQDKLQAIHVAGTNGKGSTCSMIYYILEEQGYKVGLFSSPHLKKYNERILVDGEYISDADFARHIGIVKNKVSELFDNEFVFFSFFEIITAAAFNYFFERNVDFVVLEVGLGGRLDSTNIIKNPLVSVISSISIDHTEYLGNTISQIAKEKGGIIKKNSFTVLYSQSKEVYNIIKGICMEKNSRLFYAEDYGIEILKHDLTGTIFNVKNSFFSYDKIYVKLYGDYQVFNVCNTLMAIEALRERNVVISDDAVFGGLKKTKIRGRMEVIMREPLFILEGAHNVEGVDYLNGFLKNLKNSNKKNSNKKIIMLIGILKDKNCEEMITKLSEFCDIVIFTEPNSKRAMKSENLFEMSFLDDKQVFVEKDFRKAVNLALKISSMNDCIVCAGSLYLVGNVLEYCDKMKLF